MRKKKDRREGLQGCSSFSWSLRQALLIMSFQAIFSLLYLPSPLFAGFGRTQSRHSKLVQALMAWALALSALTGLLLLVSWEVL